jgi:hypothetical protein
MTLKNLKRPASDEAGPALHLGDPFFFLPLVAEALKDTEVSCPFCCVKMINRAGLVRGLCPACFEERCAKCGTKVILENGGLAPGLIVGRAGSWECEKCAKAGQHTAADRHVEASANPRRNGSRRLRNGSGKRIAA